MFAPLLLLASSIVAGPGADPAGTISGDVVNASRGNSPAGGAEIVLRTAVDGQLVPFRTTKADAQGRFTVSLLPIGSAYVPGANRDGIHYPGPSVQLTAERPIASVRLSVCDSVAEPSPLVIRRHDILIRPEAGVLRVTESLLVDNPTSTCYVGKSSEGSDEPVTLTLAIPSDFQRTTFDKEFFGRRFHLVDGKLANGIPWTPGRREVKFTYVLANDKPHRVWERPLDLPCSELCLRVATAHPEEVSCNLPSAPSERAGEVAFRATGETLSLGHTIRVELGRLPVAWMVYGRWIALGALVVLAGGACVAAMGRGRSASRPSSRDPQCVLKKSRHFRRADHSRKRRAS
jgi:hypothetical protein